MHKTESINTCSNLITQEKHRKLNTKMKTEGTIFNGEKKLE